jgi:hypothetical protein
MQVPLRRIARQARMSHGHLSKVERGEHGRPVTPAITAAYERVTGIKLTEAACAVAERRDRDTGRRASTWRPGQLTDMRRQAYNATIGAIAIGGHLNEPVSRLIDSTGRPVTPTPPDYGDVAQLEQLVSVLTTLDLRHGGGLISQAAKALLRWAAPMLDPTHQPPEMQRQVATAVSALAARAGWAAFDVDSHEAARSLFRLALSTAARADDPDLRAHILADVAAQHNHLGYHHDALAIIRLAEGDERLAPGVRIVLHGVKARIYAALGAAGPCRRQITHADTIHADHAQDADGPPDWVATLLHPGHLHAATGHALATLTQLTGAQTDADNAQQRLTQAIAELNPATHTRAHTLAATRLAILQLNTGQLDTAANTARTALRSAPWLRSARVTHNLATLRTTTNRHRDHPGMQALTSEITTMIGEDTTSSDTPDPTEASEPGPR